MKKIILGLIAFIVLGFFILPEIGFCQTTEPTEPNLAASLPLTEKIEENLLDIIHKEVLPRANSNLFMESLYGYNQDLLRQTGAVVLIKNSILKEQIDYWLGKKIQGFSYKFMGNVLRLVKAYFFSDISEVINVFEQLTVTEAINYALEKLTSLEVKVASGEIGHTYKVIKSGEAIANFQYIIIYYPTGPEKGFILAEFYSKNPVEPPLGTGPNVLGGNADNGKTNCWPWDRWLEVEHQGNNDGKIEPFIVRVRGYVVKGDYKLFIWDKSKPKPEVEVDFNHPVPEISQSDVILAQTSAEKTQSFIQTRVIDPLFAKLDLLGQGLVITLKESKDNAPNRLNEIKSNAAILWQKIQDFFSNWSPDARISQGLVLESQNDFFPSQSAFATLGALELLTDQATKLSSQTPQPAKPAIPALIQPHGQVGLSEMQEIIDEIAEQVDLLSANLQKSIPIVQLEVLPLAATTTLTEIKNEKKHTPAFATSTATSTVFQTVVASSTESKISFCSIENPGIPKRESVIFNEIAWMGTNQSPNDEWMELKNVSGNPKTLAGWQIQNQTSKIKIGLNGSTLPSGGFYLLERSSDNALPTVLSDQIYTGVLSNQGENLYLFNHLCQLEDQITAINSWPGGKNDTKQTMERRPDLSWQTSQWQGGTPKYENSSSESIPNIGANPAAPTPPPVSQPQPIIIATSTPPIATTTPPIATSTLPIATTTQPNIVNQLLITEIQTQTEEFVEIYNQGTSGIPLTNLFLAYYSANSEWQNPYRKWRFPATSTIPSQSHFLIGIYGFPETSGNPNSDWQAKNQTNQPYSTGQLSNTSGAVGLFSCDPSIATSSQQAQTCKIDLASWGLPTVTEGRAFLPSPDLGFSLNRIKNQQGQFQDTNENSADFVLTSATPFNSQGQTYQPPALPAIIDLTAHPSNQRKAIELFWTSNNAKQYLIKASNQEITNQNWNQAQEIPNILQPQTAGRLEHFKIENLDSNQFWYFAIKTIAPNNATSAISNSAKAKPLPELQTISNETILDPLTNALWLKTIPSQSTTTNQTSMAFENLGGFLFSFNSASSTQNTTGQYTWRAPYFKELSAITDFSKATPTINETLFPQTPSDCFWSSSHKKFPATGCIPGFCATPAYTKTQAIDFKNGSLNSFATQSKNCYLRPVLSQTADPLPFSAFDMDGEPSNACNLTCSDNNDKTITDNCTNLMWVKNGTSALLPSRPTVAGGAPGDITWEAGIKLCAKLVLCNDGTFLQEDGQTNCDIHNGIKYNDWRMPTILENIFAVRANCPYIFPWASGYNYYYWSSTLSADGKPFGLIQDQTIQTYIFEKTSALYLQCVRYAN